MYNSTELMAILVNGMDDISKIHDIKEICVRIEKLLVDLTASETAELLLRDESKSKLVSTDKKTEYLIDNTQGVLGQTLSQTKPAFFNHVRSEKNFSSEADNPSEIKLKAQLIYPIMKNREILGLLRLSRSIRMPKNYTQNDITLLKSIEVYLIKMIHILKNDIKRIQIDPSEVSQNIQKLEKDTSAINSEINDSMLFLSNTVHDIRTPANSLYGFLDLMEEQFNDKKLINFIQNAKQSAEFINTLTDSILERVKYENEIRTSEPEAVNSVVFFSSIANIFSANMTSKGIHYLVKIDPSLPKEIKLETIKLKRIIINLIGNAYKFTPTGKVIEFSVNYVNNRVLIGVKDTGLGIEESRQKDIFKAFAQAKEDTSIHFGGTGLGLAICSKYVDDLGGHLKLDSKLDEGSYFSFDIPVELADKTISYKPYKNFDKLITICTDNHLCIDANYMKEWLEMCGVPADDIIISDKIKKETTHLICFEHKLDDTVMKTVDKQAMKLILLEEKLFSLSKEKHYNEYPILSKNNYYLDVLYNAVSCKHIPTVLIVDDNKINVRLLESILEGESCEVTSKYNGEDGLKILTKALVKGNPFDIVFSDKHMDGLSGTEMLKSYRDIETENSDQKSIYAVSITGDPKMGDEEKILYNKVLHKPFRNGEIINVINKIP